MVERGGCWEVRGVETGMGEAVEAAGFEARDAGPVDGGVRGDRGDD